MELYSPIVSGTERISGLQEELRCIFQQRPIIAAVRSPEDLSNVIASEARAIALMGGHILQLAEIVAQLHEQHYIVLLHPELIHGIGRDIAGIDYLAEIVKPDGIVSTKKTLLQRAKEHNLLTVFQFFAIDTQAVLTGLENAKNIKPDFIEVMPGLIPELITWVQCSSDISVIAAGLIRNPESVDLVLKAGACAATTSRSELWNYCQKSDK